VVGSNGGVAETRAVVDGADLVIFVGCRAGSVTTERWRHPAPGGSKVIHVDIDPPVIGANYAADVALIGDARLALEALVQATDAGPAERRSDAEARVGAARAAKFAAFDALAASTERPIRPEAVIAALNRVLPAEAVVVADPGTPCPYVAAYYRQTRPGRQVLTNRAHGALGYALSAALGARFARAQAPVVALMGDGSFGFTAGELETVARLGLPLTLIVFANASFGWIKAGQKVGYQERYFSVDFSATDHAAVARAYGLPAWRVEDPADLDHVLRQALDDGRPGLIDVIAQPLHQARAPVSEWVA